MAALVAEVIVEAAVVWGTRAYNAYRLYRTAMELKEVLAKAEELSDAKDREKICEDCPKKIPCFDPPPNGNDAEMVRQLKDQQDAINEMSPDQILDQIAKYKKLGREGAAPGEAALRAIERAKYESSRTESLTRAFRRQGMGKDEAEALARAQVKDEMKNLNVTHTPDLRAGGTGKTSGLGDASVNRHIGNQWKNGRADALEAEAKKAKAQGKEKMDVKLEKC